jgi:uncharacterized zinc-type alcohol dehydrogenase-like protein
MFCHQCRSGDHNLCPQQERTIVHRHGGFADRVRCDWTFALPLPETLSFETSGAVRFGVQQSDRVGIKGDEI